MCLAIPGQVIEFDAAQPQLAKVDVSGVRRNVNIALLEDDPVVPGDWILIHVGFALSKIGEEEAQDQLRMLRAMGEDELALEEVRGYTFDHPSGAGPPEGVAEPGTLAGARDAAEKMSGAAGDVRFAQITREDAPAARA